MKSHPTRHQPVQASCPEDLQQARAGILDQGQALAEGNRRAR